MLNIKQTQFTFCIIYVVIKYTTFPLKKKKKGQSELGWGKNTKKLANQTISCHVNMSFQVVQHVKCQPAVPETQEVWVWPLGQENPLEEGMPTMSSVIAWRIPQTEEPDGLL